MLAQLISCVVNFSHPRSRPEKPVEPRDFMTSEIRKRARQRPQRINRKQVIAETRRYFAALREKQ